MSVFDALFDTSDFTPRWYCGQWSSAQGWTHILSDIAIFGAYTAIPITLAFFVSKRRDIPFPRLFWLFVLFIFSCGTSHLLEAVIFWYPIYRVAGVVKAITALASWGTVIALVPIVPRALNLPNLERVNASLESEVAERRRTEAVLRDSESRYKAILDTAADGIVTIDSDGIIASVNFAVETLFGYTRDELIGHNVSILMPSPDRERHDDYLDRYLETGEKRIIGMGREVVGRRKDGSTFDMHLSIGEFQQAGARYFTGIIQDITRRKQAEVELIRLNSQLNRKNREMEEFLSIIAHDLKHPAVSIQWLLSTLRSEWDERFDDETRQNVNLMMSECGRMKEMLTQLSELARLERVEVKRERVNLRLFLESCVDPFRSRLSIKLCDISVSAPNVEVVMPRTMVQQAVSNLLDNALKYGCPPRGGHIRVSAEGSQGECSITVQDNGPGIDPKYHERVFQPFRRLARDEQAEGSGIGLTAVRRLAQKFDGTVRLVSDIGRGAAFTLTFPTQVMPVTHEA